MIYTAYRLYKAWIVSYKYARKVFRYAIASRETATFTYNLTEENQLYLLNLTAQVTKVDISVIEVYYNELKNNLGLQKTIISHIDNSPFRKKKDKRCDYGNKFALYAIVRALKPEVVVENGVELGFTSMVLCEAIRRNREEGYNGKFIGLDINNDAGDLVRAIPDYAHFIELKCGDAVDSLHALENGIGFYFSDGYRSYKYEQAEFAALEQKLGDKAIVITNKAKFSKALYEFSRRLGKNYSFFKEDPVHWYEGSGLGFMYP